MSSTNTHPLLQTSEPSRTPPSNVPQNASKNRQIMLMDHARSTASFDSRKLTYLLYGGYVIVSCSHTIHLDKSCLIK